MGKSNTENLRTLKEKPCAQCNEIYIGMGNTKYCSRKCAGMNSYESRMLDPEFRLNKLMCMAKNRAKSKELPFNLDIDYLLELWEDSDGRCPISNIEFDLNRTEKGKVNPYAPSLDRVTPSLGYIKGNVRIIVYQLNVALSDFGIEQFEEFVSSYIQNNMHVL